MENKHLIDISGMDEIEVENTSVEEIDSEVVNLIFLGIDNSGSMSSFASDMRNSLKDFKDALSNSKEADEILVARADFESTITIGGYKKISEFDTTYSTADMTALYDTVVEGSDKLLKYIEFLKNQGMRVKAVFAIFSDGHDNYSGNSSVDARKAIDKLNDDEITTAFISFGSGAKNIAQSLNFKNELSVGSSTSELRKAFNCLSKSVIESSKAVIADPKDFFQM